MKRMRYECPKCGNMKKPKVVNHFPPVIVLCLDCNHKNVEVNFIKKDTKNFTRFPQDEH